MFFAGVVKFPPEMGEAACESDALEPFGEGLINFVAVTLELSIVGDGVGFRIVAEDFEQAFQTAPGLPVVVNGVCGGGAVNPEVALGGAAFAGGEIVDGGLMFASAHTPSGHVAFAPVYVVPLHSSICKTSELRSSARMAPTTGASRLATLNAVVLRVLRLTW